MGIVLLQILQWILRIILFLVLFLLILTVIVLVVPIRYQVKGQLAEKQPEVRGRITWFLHLVYIKFLYEKKFRMQLRVCGIVVYDNHSERTTDKKRRKGSKIVSKENEEYELAVKEDSERSVITDNEMNQEGMSEDISEMKEDDNRGKLSKVGEQDVIIATEDKCEEDTEQEIIVTDEDVSEIQKIEEISENSKKKTSKEKKNIFKEISIKIQSIISKIKDMMSAVQEGRVKVEHYLELWNRRETQVTFQRAKKKLGKMIKAVLPRNWYVSGEIGFEDPTTTGYVMGILGSLYPILKSRVQIIPNFENKMIQLEMAAKGHIRLGNLFYQVVSLLLNKQCFKFIKLIFEELDGSEKKEEI